MTKNILQDKNCLVTGATGGIGSEIAKQLATKKCNLFLTSTDNKKLEKLKKEILNIENAISVNYVAANLLQLADISRVIKTVRKYFKSIDVLVNCTGVFDIMPLNKTSIREFENSFNINVRAPFLFCKEFSKDMIRKKWGRIVNIGSSSSYSGFNNSSAYCTSKHAILGLSRALQSELKEYNVRTFCISPSSTKTTMAMKSTDQNFNTFLDPKEVAEVIAFLISFDKEMIVDEIKLSRMVIE